MKTEELEILRSEAEVYINSKNYIIRSCWNCNLAHEHLKSSSVPLNCFGCGNWYFKGECLMDKPNPKDSMFEALLEEMPEIKALFDSINFDTKAKE